MITIVTGLSRSGTSLMMQMLRAGGIPLAYSESDFPADEHNPHGYFEFADMRHRIADPAYLDEIDGHAIKVWPHLLDRMPFTHRTHSQAIYMYRSPVERYSSLTRMYNNNRPSWLRSAELLEYNNFMTRTVDEMQAFNDVKQDFIDYIKINFNDVIRKPNIMSRQLWRFFGQRGFYESEAALVVDTLKRYQ